MSNLVFFIILLFFIFQNSTKSGCRCITAVIAGSEYVRLDREHEQRQPFPNGHAGGTLNSAEAETLSSVEASIKSTMQLFVKLAAGIILDSWSEANR